MLKVSDATKKAYQNDGSIKNYTITFPNLKNANGEAVTFTNPTIVAESITIKEGIQSGNNLDFVGCLSSSADFELAKNDYDFKDQIVTISVEVAGTDPINLFYGKVDKVTKEGAYAVTKKISAYDKMHEFDDLDATEWYNSLTYPITYKQFRDSFWKKFGKVEGADDNQQVCELINDDITISKRQLGKESTIKASSVVRAICQVNACFGMFDREGKFKYVYLDEIQEALYPAKDLYPDTVLFPSAENPGAEVYAASRIINIKYEDNKTDKIVGVIMYDDTAITYSKTDKETSEKSAIAKVGSTGKDDNKFEIENNFLLYGFSGTVGQQMANRIFDKVKVTQYREMDLKLKGLPYVECGDVMVLEGAGDIVRTYVLSRTITGTSDLQDNISAKGEKVDSEIIPIDEVISAEIFRRRIGNDHLYTEFEQTSESIKIEVQNVDEQLRTAIELTDGKIVAEVERAQNSESAITSRLVIAENEISVHSQNISALASNINLKADKVTVDASITQINGTLSAQSASIGSLTTRVANVETLAAKAITADTLSSTISSLGSVTIGGTFRIVDTASFWFQSHRVYWGTLSVGSSSYRVLMSAG